MELRRWNVKHVRMVLENTPTFTPFPRGAAVASVRARVGEAAVAQFGPERYRNIMTSSRGHSVPVVNDHEQEEGAERAARVVEHSHGADRDLLSIDMAAAYPAQAGLTELRRSVALDRQVPGGKVTLSDSFAFADGGGEFQSVLVTPLGVEIGTDDVRIGDAQGGVRVRFNPASVAVSTETHRGVEKQYAPSVDVTRVLFATKARASRGEMALEIAPL